jgi:hypothetical protein
MPVGDVVLGAIEVNQDVAGASGSGERAKKTSRHVRSNYEPAEKSDKNPLYRFAHQY